jgi:hypothetical protein
LSDGFRTAVESLPKGPKIRSDAAVEEPKTAAGRQHTQSDHDSCEECSQSDNEGDNDEDSTSRNGEHEEGDVLNRYLRPATATAEPMEKEQNSIGIEQNAREQLFPLGDHEPFAFSQT